MKLRSLILIAGLAMAGPALAQPPAPSPEVAAARAAMQKACAGDITSLCAGKTGREINQCLRDAGDKVSAPCKDAMSKLPRPGGPPPG